MNTNRIRVLHARNFQGVTEISGPESYLITLFSRLDKFACDGTLACIVSARGGDAPWQDSMNQAGVRCAYIPVRHRAQLRDAFAIRELASRFGAELIHSHDHRADISGLLAARSLGIPLVATHHGWAWSTDRFRSRVYPWLDKRALRRASRVIVVTPQALGSLADSVPARNLVVIPNGLDTDQFCAEDCEPRRFFDPADFVVGVVGRLHPFKGQRELLQAGIALAETHPTLRILLVGATTPGFEGYRKELEALSESEPLKGRVIFTQCTQSEMPGVYAGLDAVAAPSHAENLSYALLEALSMERAVVTTRVGGNVDLIEDGVTGYLVPVANVSALAEALATLADAPAQRLRLGAAGRELVITRFGADAMAQKTVDLYREVLALA